VLPYWRCCRCEESSSVSLVFVFFLPFFLITIEIQLYNPELFHVDYMRRHKHIHGCSAVVVQVSDTILSTRNYSSSLGS
jgi:hypothetical protein